MAMGSDENNITKIAARDFMSMVKNQDMNYVIDALVHTTLYGQDYPLEHRHGRLEMSYYCRAFNITECNVSKQKNRIKGRYKKYAQVPGIEKYLRQILTKNWPAFPSEQPRIDDLLSDFASGKERQSTTSQQKVYSQPKSQNKYPGNTGNAFQRKGSSGNTGNAFQEDNQGNDTNEWAVGAAGFVVVLVIVVFCLKSCGATSGVISSLWTSIKTLLIRMLKFAATVFGVGFPVLWFVINKAWKHMKPTLVGVVFFLISAWMFSIGGTTAVVIGVIFWCGGIALWNENQISRK